jgi:DNA mismatch endonuclease (patch repair protein)
MKRIQNYLDRNFKKSRAKDALSKRVRSALMSKIRSKETKFEQDFIYYLRKATKKKFETNVSSIKGKPDIVFLRQRVCVFLDSDFWHGWYYPRWRHLLKNDFWRDKIENNRRRDKRTTAYLKRNNWTVLRFWEHQIKSDYENAFEKIIKYISAEKA